uniref:Uncharacterized protein n=1 Tax=Daphnia galeata TaxID=27404 RepID=A0A8J2WEH8_9CRUS|nr:unnamed protein product [Daphnia galeata]
MQDSFQIILQQKFIDGLDLKLQMKVKYKTFQKFDELVSETRKYSVRLEAIEGNKEKHEFVNQISKTSDVSKLRESLEFVDLKQLIEKQNEKHSESVKAVVAALKDEFKSNSAAPCTEQSDMYLRLLELTKAANYLLSNGNDQGSRPPKNVSFQLLDQQQGMRPSGVSFHPSQKYNSEPGQHFMTSPNGSLGLITSQLINTVIDHCFRRVNRRFRRVNLRFHQVNLGVRQMILLGLQR